MPFHGSPAANPLGPAAGPQDQMAQNIVLAWLAGSRILELKTVQVNDRLVLPRPCIDATNVGYNVEWSQELRLRQSLREYVAGSMLVDVLGHEGLGRRQLADTIYDMSVGYDLAGVQSAPVVEWIAAMKDAAAHVDALRAEIPDDLKRTGGPRSGRGSPTRSRSPRSTAARPRRSRASRASCSRRWTST